MASSKFILPKNCEICDKKFNAKTIYSKYCSQKCSEACARKKKSLHKQEEKRQQLTGGTDIYVCCNPVEIANDFK